MVRDKLVNDMINLFGSSKVMSSELERYTYTYDSSFVSQQNEYYPDVVVCLNSTADVSRLMKYAWENEVPVTPRGAGSGQTEAAWPSRAASSWTCRAGKTSWKSMMPTCRSWCGRASSMPN